MTLKRELKIEDELNNTSRNEIQVQKFNQIDKEITQHMLTEEKICETRQMRLPFSPVLANVIRKILYIKISLRLTSTSMSTPVFIKNGYENELNILVLSKATLVIEMRKLQKNTSY